MTLKISSFALALCLPLNALATTATEVWAKGVDRDSGWFDFNKTQDYIDFGKCWAAAGSNVLAWWQKQYKVPTGTPQGEAVWETFRTSFAAYPGSLPKYAIEWWLTGDYDKAGDSAWAQLVEDAAPGGYYKSYFSEGRNIDTYLKESVDPEYKIISRALTDYLNQGYGVTLSLRDDAKTYNHEITLWGLEYDSDGITKLFVTDSDDAIDSRNNTEATLLELVCYEMETSTGKSRLGVQHEEKSGIYVANFDALGPADFLTSIPEPSAFGLLIGIVALAFAGTRRSRKFLKR